MQKVNDVNDGLNKTLEGSYDYTPYLAEYPFLVPAYKFLEFIDVSIDKIETTNIYDGILYDIFNELAKLIFNKKEEPSENFKLKDDIDYEVIRFYLTISVLKMLDNLVITKLWIKNYLKTLDKRISDYIEFKDINVTKLFYIIFKYLLPKEQLKPNKVTINGDVGLSWHVMIYLDMATNVNGNDPEYGMLALTNQNLHKGYVSIPAENTDDIIRLIKWTLQNKIFDMVNSPQEFDYNETHKLKAFIDTLINKVIKEVTTANSNIAKSFIGKEQAIAALELRDQEYANVAIQYVKRTIETGTFHDIPNFPPCINWILRKMLEAKKHLRHNENMLLATYLGKKRFSYEQALFIFQQAVNFNKGTTEVQLKALMVKKHYMPSSCSVLATEHLCHKDHICEKYKIKNPLVYHSES